MPHSIAPYSESAVDKNKKRKRKMKYDLTENTKENKTKESLVDFSCYLQGHANIIK